MARVHLSLVVWEKKQHSSTSTLPQCCHLKWTTAYSTTLRWLRCFSHTYAAQFMKPPQLYYILPSSNSSKCSGLGHNRVKGFLYLYFIHHCKKIFSMHCMYSIVHSKYNCSVHAMNNSSAVYDILCINKSRNAHCHTYT